MDIYMTSIFSYWAWWQDEYGSSDVSSRDFISCDYTTSSETDEVCSFSIFLFWESFILFSIMAPLIGIAKDSVERPFLSTSLTTLIFS